LLSERRNNRALFFIRAVGGSSETWKSQLQYFVGAGYEVVAPDLLSHGFSAAPDDIKLYKHERLYAILSVILDKTVRWPREESCDCWAFLWVSDTSKVGTERVNSFPHKTFQYIRTEHGILSLCLIRPRVKHKERKIEQNPKSFHPFFEQIHEKYTSSMVKITYVIYLSHQHASILSPDHLELDKSPNIRPLTSRWELDKFKNC
jgi:hypothetical protein